MARKVSSPTNEDTDGVATARTSAPCFWSVLSKEIDLYAAIPPVMPTSIRAPWSVIIHPMTGIRRSNRQIIGRLTHDVLDEDGFHTL